MTDTNESQEHAQVHRLAQAGRLQDWMLDLWKRTRIDWSFVTGELTGALRGYGRLGSDERRLLTETLFGMIRHLRRIDEGLAAGGLASAARTADRAADRERLLAYLVLEAGLPVEEASRQAPGVDWLRVAEIDARLAREGNLARRIARTCSLPDWLAESLVGDLGERAAELASALNQRAPMTIRVNTLCASPQDLAAWLAEEGVATQPGRYVATALHVETRANLFGLPSFQKGGFEPQDEASQVVAALVAPPPRALVVDYCAGAGGKTLAMAAALGNRGRITATDVDGRKLRELRRRLKRAGATNVQSVVVDPDGSWPTSLARLEGTAQRVLVDAPCSGLGTLRRHPEMRWRLSQAELDRFPARQLDLCQRALSLVEPGGHFVYATCTVLAAENQRVIERLLAAHPSFELVPARDAVAPVLVDPARAAELTDPTGSYLTMAPDRHGTDGFFAAVLRRKA